MRERRILLAASLLACLGLWASPSIGQPPGPKKEEPPRTTAEKLKEQKDAFKESFDWSEALLKSGEVDERRDEFLKKMGCAGEPFIVSKESKKTYMIQYGEASTEGPSKPGFVRRRSSALSLAELKARVKIAAVFKDTLSSEQSFERFHGVSDEVKAQLKKVKKASDDGAIPEDAFNQVVSSFVHAQVIGAYTVKTIEGMQGDEYKVIRILLWSETVRDLAMNVMADADYFLPAEKIKPDEVNEISLKPEKLLREFGTKVYFNQQGQRYYVSYGQAEPIAENRAEAARAKEIAEDLAELEAKGSLVRTLAADITAASSGLQDLTLSKMGKGQSVTKATEELYQRLESSSGKIKITGAFTYHKRTYFDPEWKVPVSVAVVVWTPNGRQTVKDLGLDAPIDLRSSTALLGYLTRKYGETPGTKKPGIRESEDPKKIP